MVSKINRIPLREVWKHEALHFTTWLVENLDVLSDAIGLTLQDAKREHAAGDFSIDLVAEDENGEIAIIENQLEKSNHDHLGKVLTYVASLNARIAVWIVAEPRTEHIRAINWLNESRLANFYLLKLEAIRIGESDPAPLLTLITGPSEETREVGDTKKDIAERYVIRRNFWERLLEKAKSRTRLHETISPSNYSWIATGAGKAGLSFLYSITQHEATAELVIDRGKGSEAENKSILSQLKSHQNEIEKAFGGPLEWYEQESVRLCRIRDIITIGGYRDPEEKWSEIQDAMIDGMIRLEKTIRPYLGSIQ